MSFTGEHPRSSEAGFTLYSVVTPFAPVVQLVTFLTRWGVSSTPGNYGIFPHEKKKKKKDAQQVEND